MMDIGYRDIDNGLKAENVEKVIEFFALDSEDPFDKAITLGVLEAMPDADSDLSNAALYLRDENILNAYSDGEDIFLKVNDDIEEDELNGYVRSPEPELEDDQVTYEELEEVAEFFGKSLEAGETRVSLNQLDEMLEDDRNYFQELNILSGIGYLEINKEDGEISYSPVVEKADEFRELAEEAGYAPADQRYEEGEIRQTEWHRNNPWKPPV